MNDKVSKLYVMLELWCVFLWFMLDGFWLLEWKIPTYVFSGAALWVAFAMFFWIRKEITVILVACADVSWLLFNICWAIGDLDKVPRFLTLAKTFFLLGIGMCTIAFGTAPVGQRLSTLVLSRIRILNFFRPSC